MAEDYWNTPSLKALDAYSRTANPSLTDQLLYAVLAELQAIGEKLDSKGR
jgi:hypothetical protein